MDGDPAEIAPRCRDMLRERALLLDPTRLHIRSLARIAHAARRLGNDASLDDWLRECIAKSIDDLVDEDRESERSGIPPSEPWDPRYAFMTEVLGLEPTIARRACAEFNLLPHRVRCAFFAVAIEGKTIRRFVAEGNGPPAVVRADIARAAGILGIEIRPRMVNEGATPTPTGEHLQLDPEFEGILREVTSNPDAVLSPPSRPSVPPSMHDREEPIRPSATGLDAVEGKLVTVYRSEMAWLLRQACLHKLLSNEANARIMNRYATSADYRLSDVAEISRRHEKLEHARALGVSRANNGTAIPGSRQNDLANEAARLIGEFSRAPAGPSTVLALASLSLRLEPTNQGRLLAAIGLLQRGSPQLAIRFALAVLDANPTSDHIARAWECIAAAYLKLGNETETYRAYCRGCEQVDAPCLILMNRLLFAAQFGLEKDVIECAQRLGELLRPDHPALDHFVASQRQARRQHEWMPSREAIALANRVDDKVNSVARQILHVLT
jgi:hypothetical protein